MFFDEYSVHFLGAVFSFVEREFQSITRVHNGIVNRYQVVQDFVEKRFSVFLSAVFQFHPVEFIQ